MIKKPIQTLFRRYILSSASISFSRNIRSIAPRGDTTKYLKGKVKTLTEYDESDQFDTYEDFIKSINKSKLGDELEVEKEFLNADYHGDVFERCEQYYDAHKSEEQQMRSRIKKSIVGRKYFQLEKETSLLTYAAKEQIRFLHKTNPLEWNYKALSECFPISEAGVKKLLKSSFVLTCPEKIKLHDEDVARKWKILKSGKCTNEIFPLTQKLYKEGKLVDDYFSGNPNLPTVPPSTKKVIEIKKPEPIGEFSAIVKTYVDYEKQKLLESGKGNSTETQLSLKDRAIRKDKIFKNIKKFKYVDDDDDDDARTQVSLPQRRRKSTDLSEISFSNFKEVIREETNLKKSKYRNEYDDFVMQDTLKKDNSNIPSNKVQDSEKCFFKISKYNNENVNIMMEKNKQDITVYTYDEKLGYQFPAGKNIKDKIKLPIKHKEKKLHKVGMCVYDENGEFLYRIS